MRPLAVRRIEKTKKSKSRAKIEPPLGFAKDAGGHDV
jgi:hypothetical protein